MSHCIRCHFRRSKMEMCTPTHPHTHAHPNVLYYFRIQKVSAAKFILGWHTKQNKRWIRVCVGVCVVFSWVLSLPGTELILLALVMLSLWVACLVSSRLNGFACRCFCCEYCDAHFVCQVCVETLPLEQKKKRKLFRADANLWPWILTSCNLTTNRTTTTRTIIAKTTNWTFDCRDFSCLYSIAS